MFKTHGNIGYIIENHIIEPTQIEEIEQTLERYSRNTIKKDMAFLVNEGFLLNTGAGRGVRYYLKK